MKQILSAGEIVQIAREQLRPTAEIYIKRLIDDFVELHGDRYFGDDPSIIAGIGTIKHMPITVIGQNKGTNTSDRVKNNFGMPHPEGYRKALRLMKQAEKFNRPILNIVDTPGAYPGIGAEERGQGEAIARSIMEMSSLKVPTITLIIGEGGSGGALALAVSDVVWMMEYSIYSILSPEGFATILWKDVKRSKEAAEVMKLTSYELKKRGIIDDYVEEPEGGIKANMLEFFEQLQGRIYQEFQTLQSKPIKQLLGDRHDKFRKIGHFIDSNSQNDEINVNKD
jgi:acetyl-CoA carboxylase carboxyl transferase subunit alpha